MTHVSDARPSMPLQIRDRVAIGFGVAVIVGVCLIVSARRPALWYDELVTELLVRDPSVLHMLRVIAVGGENNPPLYELVMRGWVAVAGASPLMLRLPSAILMAASLILLWRELRGQFGFAATAVALGLTFFRADALLDQMAQARFYGLFVFAASAALVLATRAARMPSGTTAYAPLAFAAHLLLVYSHTFGIVYSGAILVGLLLARAPSPPRAFESVPILAAWLAFVPWVPAVLQQATMAEPRLWIQAPDIGDLISVVKRLTSTASLYLLGLGAVAAPFIRGARVWRSREERTLAVLGSTMVGVIVLMFVLSHVAKPVFVDRYMIPSALGWPLLVGLVCERIALRWRSPLSVEPIGGLAFAVLGASALYAASRRERFDIPRDIGTGGVPVVAESALRFLPMHRYVDRSQSVVFVLDWSLALDPKNAPSAVQEYKLMELFAREGYLDSSVVGTDQWRCGPERFVVVDDPAYLWMERRLDPADWTRREMHQFQGASVQLVERRGNAADCVPATP